MTAPLQIAQGLFPVTALKPEMPPQSSTSTNLTGLRDNHNRGKAGEFLLEKISPGSALSFVSAYFTVHAYQAMKDKLEAASGLRFLFGEPCFIRIRFDYPNGDGAGFQQCAARGAARSEHKWRAFAPERAATIRGAFAHWARIPRRCVL